MALRIVKELGANGASICFIQSLHREAALGYLIHGAGLVHKENLAALPNEPMFIELEEVMPKWAIETLAQGAYIREYHLWEKETKEFFFSQIQLNGYTEAQATSHLKQKRNESIIAVVQRQLNQFGLNGLENEMIEIDGMRTQVNKAKHNPGVLLDHFVSMEQFWKKHAAIQKFWLKLTEA